MIRQGLFAAALVWAMPAVAADPLKPFQPEDLFKVVTADNPTVSPDGAWITYVRAAPDILADRPERSLWLVTAKGGPAQRIGEEAGSQSGAAWSPDGRTIAYVATAPEKTARLMLFDVATRTATMLAEMEATPADLAFAPDGKSLAFVSFVPGPAPQIGKALVKPEGAKWAEPLQVYDRLRWKSDDEGILKPGTKQVFIVPVAGGAPRQLTSGDFHIGSMAWDADSRAIVVSTNRDPDWQRQPDESDLWRYPLDGGAPARLTTRKGPDEAPAPSPDGRSLAWVGYDDPGAGFSSHRLYVADRDGGNRRDLTPSLDRTVAKPVWSADGRSLIVSYGDKGLTRLARVTLDGRMTPLTDALASGGLDRPYTGGSFAVGGKTVAFTTADTTHAREIAVLDKGKPRRLTDVGGPLARERELATIRPLPVVSSRDGKSIEAWIVLPPGYKGGRLPTILEIHGGPNLSYGPTFATDMQLYAAAGYAVVYPNARNSANYGDGFANWTRFDIPFADSEDMLSTIDAAIAAGFADPDNLFVTGGSYGGYASAMLVGLSDRFRAAAIQKPVIEWASKILTTDVAPYQAKSPYGANPWERPQDFWRNSPLSLVANVKTPSLLIVGDKDYRTPMSQAEQFYTALKLRGVPSALIVVPGASHALTARPSQNAARVSAILDWFERYRKK